LKLLRVRRQHSFGTDMQFCFVFKWEGKRRCFMAKFSNWLTEDRLTLLQSYARAGLTEAQIAHNCGCSLTFLKSWKN
jgi:hypothetical protein